MSVMHMQTGRDPKAATTLCGRTLDYAEACGFQSAVTCPDCRRLIDHHVERTES